jgi:type 1 glutamine amidotransferase
MPRRPGCSARIGIVLATLALSACGSGGNGTPTTPTPPTPPTPTTRILVVTHTEGFRHDSIPAAETAIRDIGLVQGLYTTDYCRTADDVRRLLVPQALTSYQAVVFANTTGNLPIPDLAAFLAWIAGGGGFLGIHSASDTFHDEPSYLAMLGAEFTTHGAIVEAEVRVDDPSDPSVAHLAPSFRISDEFYRFAVTDAGMRRLLSLGRDPQDGAPVSATMPLSWSRHHSAGRVFYTALGHRSELWQDPRYRRHILEGLRWTLAR